VGLLWFRSKDGSVSARSVWTWIASFVMFVALNGKAITSTLTRCSSPVLGEALVRHFIIAQKREWLKPVFGAMIVFWAVVARSP